MADEAAQPTTTPDASPTKHPERKPLPTWARYVIGASIILCLLWLQSMAAGRRAHAMVRDATVEGVEAAAALFSETRKAGTPDIDPVRAGRMVDALLNSGAYQRVTLVAAGGQVVSSTDKNLAGQTVSELAQPPSTTRTQYLAGSLRVETPVRFESRVVATLQVEVKGGG